MFKVASEILVQSQGALKKLLKIVRGEKKSLFQSVRPSTCFCYRVCLQIKKEGNLHLEFLQIFLDFSFCLHSGVDISMKHNNMHIKLIGDS